eukprot:12914434-Alexandrium_andersonii.AAC.1
MARATQRGCWLGAPSGPSASVVAPNVSPSPRAAFAAAGRRLRGPPLRQGLLGRRCVVRALVPRPSGAVSGSG